MKGSESKKIVTEKILEIFKDSFLYNGGKELRIPLTEDGERVEIKVTLTCAKVNVGGDDVQGSVNETPTNVETLTPPSAEEKANIEDLMNRLGL